jgi:Meiotically up-regulated gene 113
MKHVYAMRRPDGAIKLGISGAPETRKNGLSCQIKKPVDIMFLIQKRPDARIVEGISHKLLEKKRDTGEWFFITVEEAMQAVSQAVDIVEGLLPDTTGELKRSSERKCVSLENRPVKGARLEFRASKDLEAALKVVADKEGRSVSGLVNFVLTRYCEQSGELTVCQSRNIQKDKT